MFESPPRGYPGKDWLNRLLAVIKPDDTANDAADLNVAILCAAHDRDRAEKCIEIIASIFSPGGSEPVLTRNLDGVVAAKFRLKRPNLTATEHEETAAPRDSKSTSAAEQATEGVVPEAKAAKRSASIPQPDVDVVLVTTPAALDFGRTGRILAMKSTDAVFVVEGFLDAANFIDVGGGHASELEQQFLSHTESLGYAPGAYPVAIWSEVFAEAQLREIVDEVLSHRV